MQRAVAVAIVLVVSALMSCGSQSDSGSVSGSEGSTRQLGADDHLVALVAGSPAFRVTTRPGSESASWDLWTVPFDDEPVWTATLPAFMAFERVRNGGSTFLVGGPCATTTCDSADSLIAVELVAGAPVTRLPVDGPFQLETSFRTTQLGGHGPDLLTFDDGIRPEVKVVEVSLPERWEVRSTVAGNDPGLWCRFGDRTFVAGHDASASDGALSTVDAEVSTPVVELVDGLLRQGGEFPRPGASVVSCTENGFVVAVGPLIIGSWEPSAGWVASGERIAPAHTQVRWLDGGALWVDDSGLLKMWNGSVHDVGTLPLSDEELADHASSQSKPLGSSLKMLSVQGDIYGDHVIACADFDASAFDRCELG